MKKPSICFYSPYFPKHFGGGEKHILDIASTIANKANVSLAVSVDKLPHNQSLQTIKESYEQFFGMDLDKITFIESPLGSSEAAVRKVLWTGQFDHLFYNTDGSLFFSVAKHNHLHFQIPFTYGPTNNWDKVKATFWKHSNVISHFTQSVIKEHWPMMNPVVLYPKVDQNSFNPEVLKTNTIISVGRFFRQLHSKRQDVLIKLFSQLPKSTKERWKLLLVGSVEDESYVQELKKQARGLNVEFQLNVLRPQLIKLLETSSIYWHAAGYGIDEKKNPELVEHFGISTVEAMAAGVVPIVHYKGGQKEVLGKTLADLGWSNEEDCISITQKIIKDNKLRDQYRTKAVKQAAQFGDPVFRRRVNSLFQVA